ncbi:SMP-30/gluconolactonase/LRE family protein [Salinarimonas soli]|uniref:SMP-30/gluconolactonase/LRE family protein n=1 Tax=Salinarimonas soli TaxID=1638099 RepID=A0A5B2V7N6_9HYPH|nr:SMP-30/gluconolactonase/LRE family protein [Salinarimonas soli]KAA2235034.1 SMP-30/gluconolactonase/LRE family protein [Salinarimonas soli]
MTNPAVHPHQARPVLEAGCEVGEGPVWDARRGELLFVDIKNPAVWRLDPESGRHARQPVPERIGFVALTDDPDVVVAGFKSGLKRLRLSDGAIEPILSPEPDRPGNRINDGHVGPDGSLYFGTMDDGEAEPSGAFYRYDGSELAVFQEGIVVTNGPAVSADGQSLYATDTKAGTIFRHVLTDGRPGERQRFAHLTPDVGHPDGMAVDAQDHVWVCHWGGGRVTRFAPDGSVERIVEIPAAQVTKCAFGGPDLATLYVTSAAIGRDRAEDPAAGHVFAVDTDGIRGLPAHLLGGAR